MKRWERRVLGVLALGGSFLGLVLGTTLLVSQRNPLAIAVAIPFLGLYVWGIWCGLRILEQPDQGVLKMNAWFWAVQVPYLMSPIAGYYFASGSMLYVVYQPGTSSVSMLWRFGSQFQYSFFQLDKPFVFGVNLFAIAIVTCIVWRVYQQVI
jgi:hypothetical protein